MGETMKRVVCLRLILILIFIAMMFNKKHVFADQNEIKTGVVKDGEKTFIYTNTGELVKNKPVYCLKGARTKEYYTIDSSGEAEKLTGVRKDAAIRLIKLKAFDGKYLKNLKKAFKWSASLIYRNNTNGSRGEKAAKYYGRYGFRTQSGDCNTAAYTFYWMAELLGFSCNVVQGHVPSGSMKNLKAHTWVIIKEGKTKWYYDPDFNRAYAGKTAQTSSGMRKFDKDCGFRFKYGTPGTYKYVK